MAAFFLQKSQVCEIVPFEKQKQPRVPVLKKIQVFEIPGGIPSSFQNDVQKPRRRKTIKKNELSTWKKTNF